MSNQFTWTDEKVKEFARVYSAGRRGKYKQARKIDDKLNIFKEVGIKGVSSKTQKRGRPSTTLYLSKGDFLDWYFDNDTELSFFKDWAVGLSLLLKDKFSVRIEHIVENCGYIPAEVVHKDYRENLRLDENDEVDLSYYTTFKFVTP